MSPALHLRSLPFLARLGLSGLLVALLIGMLASATHLFWHYERRDDQKGFTMDDVKSAYHGLDAPSKLLLSLKGGHPPELEPDRRDLLMKWIASGRINEDYENIDLGVASPREIIQSSCLSCHSASAASQKGAGLKLDSLEDIRRIGFARKVQPTDPKIVVMSLHAHALSLGTLSVLLAAMLWFTRLPRGLVGMVVVANGISLPLDLASWWLARKAESLVHVIVIAGTIYNATVVLMIALILADLWWPRRTPAAAA